MCQIRECQNGPWNGSLMLTKHAATMRALSRPGPLFKSSEHYLLIHRQFFLSQSSLLYQI